MGRGTIRIDVQPVEIGVKVAAQDGELGLAVLFNQGGGSSGCHLKSTVSCLRQVNGHGIMLDAVKLTSTRLRRQAPPLLEEEIDSLSFAGIPDVNNPALFHGACIRSALAAADESMILLQGRYLPRDPKAVLWK